MSDLEHMNGLFIKTFKEETNPRDPRRRFQIMLGLHIKYSDETFVKR